VKNGKAILMVLIVLIVLMVMVLFCSVLCYIITLHHTT